MHSILIFICFWNNLGFVVLVKWQNGGQSSNKKNPREWPIKNCKIKPIWEQQPPLWNLNQTFMVVSYLGGQNVFSWIIHHKTTFSVLQGNIFGYKNFLRYEHEMINMRLYFYLFYGLKKVFHLKLFCKIVSVWMYFLLENRLKKELIGKDCVLSDLLSISVFLFEEPCLFRPFVLP